MRLLPVVQTLIAAPCDVPWDTMLGDEKKRHCTQCSRDVHNLSAMTHAEMQSFLDAMTPGNDGHLPCISLFQRTDGTVLTVDCPVGLGARRRRSLLTSTLGVGAIALVAMTALATLWLDHKTEAHLDPAPLPPPVETSTILAPPVGISYPLPRKVEPPADHAAGVRMAGAPMMDPAIVVPPPVTSPSGGRRLAGRPRPPPVPHGYGRRHVDRTREDEAAVKVLKTAMGATESTL